LKAFLIIPVLLFGIYTNSDGQILNLHKRNFENDSVKWVGNVELKFSIIKQETSVSSLSFKVNTIHFFDKNSIFLIGQSSFATKNSEAILNDGYAHLRFVFNRKMKISQEFFVQTQYNNIRGLSNRNLGGAGLRIRLSQKEAITWFLGVGLLYEAEDWDTETESITTNYLKNSNYIGIFGSPGDTFHYNAIIYYQARFDAYFNPRLSGEINLNFKISNILAFTSSFNFFYDSAPEVSVDQFVYKFINGLTFNF
jgi:hypothetical protein